MDSAEQSIQAKEAELDLLWDKIQELKLTDEFAAQIQYRKYQDMASELPPPIPG